MSVDAETKKKPQGTSIGTGTLLALCYSPELINGVGKEPHDTAHITRWGIPGDRHYGETRISKGHVVPNDRPITATGMEAARDACERLGIPGAIQPGGLGENLLLEGLGDLSDLLPGDELRVLSADGQPNVILHVRKQNEPCANLMIYHKQMPKELYGKRGVLCTVLQEGTVRLGDKVQLVRDAQS